MGVSYLLDPFTLYFSVYLCTYLRHFLGPILNTPVTYCIPSYQTAYFGSAIAGCGEGHRCHSLLSELLEESKKKGRRGIEWVWSCCWETWVQRQSRTPCSVHLFCFFFSSGWWFPHESTASSREWKVSCQKEAWRQCLLRGSLDKRSLRPKVLQAFLVVFPTKLVVFPLLEAHTCARRCILLNGDLCRFASTTADISLQPLFL